MSARLRFLTYLAPSLPYGYFEAVVRHVGARLGVETSLSMDARTSGPLARGPDPFSAGLADVGFLCSPSFLWLRERTPPPVEIVPAAPLFADPRARGEPVYFSDVIVRRASDLARGSRPHASFGGLSWAYNDCCSLSGYRNILREVGPVRGALRPSGSHLNSIRLVLDGVVDAAAIDSNVLRLRLECEPGLADRIRIVDTWGPYPIQPVVARRALDPALRAHIAAALLDLASDPAARASVRVFGALGFAPTSEGRYRRGRVPGGHSPNTTASS